MAQAPCNGDGICMKCLKKPSADEALKCKTCNSPWHVTCLHDPPETLADTLQWVCPDCSITDDPDSVEHVAVGGGSGSSDALVAAIRAIESDQSLTDREKAVRRQNLMSGKEAGGAGNNETINKEVDESLICSKCMNVLDRPVTTPCGHNFCLGCFKKWIAQGKRTCANCRHPIPAKMASQPRINSALVIAIRMAKMSTSTDASGQPKAYHYMYNQDRPDTAFTTDRAVKSGKANACSGKIFVTTAPDHFGPILAENDPVRNQGVLVGESWIDRMDCRQWGAHLPHVAGIAGQSKHGAQSVALSGGYADDQDNGEWFLYTGSGGRDLSGNKRTNKNQSSDQVFEKMNLALEVSCIKGYPVRVVRSHKEKRSCYAPEEGVRYDGVYRIEKCWRKKGVQGFVVCRYLFVRCDNEPAPWTSDEHGDRPRRLPEVKELKGIKEVIQRKGSPAWDFDSDQGRWVWVKPPPESKKKHKDSMYLEDGTKIRIVKRKSRSQSMKQKLAKELGCLICRKVMVLPLTTPCAHNFCKGCLEGVFNGQVFVKQRTCEGRRTLRAKKTIMKCPSCTNDISDFLQNPQVNRDLMGMIECVQQKIKEEAESEESSEGAEAVSEDVEETVDECSLNAATEVASPEIDEMKVEDEQEDVSSDVGKEKSKVVDVMNKGPVKRGYKKKKAASDVDEAVVGNGGVKSRKRKVATADATDAVVV